MVLSFYIFKYPYKLYWHILNRLGKNDELAVYLADPLDYIVLKPVMDHLPEYSVIVKNNKTRNYLRNKGIESGYMPRFPKSVVMCRHAAYKFPVKEIRKFGFRHGAYHFKAFTKAGNYNDFDIYFVTSENEVQVAKEKGIESAVGLGFPKLDSMFDGSFDEQKLSEFRQKAKIDSNKKTVLFSSTWEKSGMSAISEWIDKIHQLTDDYNVLVTVHPWTSKKIVKKLAKIDSIYYIDEPNIVPFLMIADVMIGDTSSIISEYCVLNKPIITFKVQETRRLSPEITSLLEKISIRINRFEDLRGAIQRSLEYPYEMEAEREKAIKLMFSNLGKQTGKMAADIIKNRLAQHK